MDVAADGGGCEKVVVTQRMRGVGGTGAGNGDMAVVVVSDGGWREGGDVAVVVVVVVVVSESGWREGRGQRSRHCRRCRCRQ